MSDMDFSVTHRLLAVTSEWTQMYLRTRYIHERGAERVIVEKERGKSTKVCLLACVQTMASTTTSYLRNALILLQFCFRFRILNPLEISLSVRSTWLRLLFFFLLFVPIFVLYIFLCFLLACLSTIPSKTISIKF